MAQEVVFDNGNVEVAEIEEEDGDDLGFVNLTRSNYPWINYVIQKFHKHVNTWPTPEDDDDPEEEYNDVFDSKFSCQTHIWLSTISLKIKI